MAKANTSAYKTFDQITGRLDEIIVAVRDKNVSLERSLDLFDEALMLGATAVDLVDTTSFTPEEEAKMSELSERDVREGDVPAAYDEAAGQADAPAEPDGGTKGDGPSSAA